MLDSLHHIDICHASPQLSYSDACQIWTWYSIANNDFVEAEMKNNGTEEIGLLSNPRPCV